MCLYISWSCLQRNMAGSSLLNSMLVVTSSSSYQHVQCYCRYHSFIKNQHVQLYRPILFNKIHFSDLFTQLTCSICICHYLIITHFRIVWCQNLLLSHFLCKITVIKIEPQLHVVHIEMQLEFNHYHQEHTSCLHSIYIDIGRWAFSSLPEANWT